MAMWLQDIIDLYQHSFRYKAINYLHHCSFIICEILRHFTVSQKLLQMPVIKMFDKIMAADTMMASQSIWAILHYQTWHWHLKYYMGRFFLQLIIISEQPCGNQSFLLMRKIAHIHLNTYTWWLFPLFVEVFFCLCKELFDWNSKKEGE